MPTIGTGASVHTRIGDLPRHHYVFVDSCFTHRKPCGFVPAVWFGLVSIPGRTWGCNVVLESGAIYRDLPPHAIAFRKDPEEIWTCKDSQTWDCYGDSFSCLEYKYLAGLRVMVKTKTGKILRGDYLFTAVPMGDGFSAYPEQAKEFSFVWLDNGRLTVQPTNHLLFIDESFTVRGDLMFPTDLKRQIVKWSCEE